MNIIHIFVPFVLLRIMHTTQTKYYTVHASNYQYARGDLQALVDQSFHMLSSNIKTHTDPDKRLPSLRELFPPALLNSDIAPGKHFSFRKASDIDCRLPPIAVNEDMQRPRKRQRELEDSPPPSSGYHVLRRQAQSSCEEDLKRLVTRAQPHETEGLPSRVWFKCTAALNIPGCAPQICGYVGEKQTVRRHIRTAHLKLKPWICSCGREFSQRCSGITHANTFNGVKNLPCLARGCREMFSDAAMRNRHVKCAHEGEVVQETRRKSAYVRTQVMLRAKL